MPFTFAGYPPYLERAFAALELSDRGTLVEARRQVALGRLATLIAGAMSGPPGAAGEILHQAQRSRDALAIALHSADSMLADARRAFGLATAETPGRADTKSARRPKG